MSVRRALAWLLIYWTACLPLYAQTQGNREDVFQSAADGVDFQDTSNTQFPVNITAGHFYIGCLNWKNSVSPTVGDNLGNTYTQGTIYNPGNHQLGRFFYGIATVSGAATFSTSLSSGTIGGANLTIADVTNDVSATVDGTQQNSQPAGLGNTPVTLSNSYTTTTNGSIIYSCAAGEAGSAAVISGNSPNEQVANSSGTAGAEGGMWQLHTGLAGTYTPQLTAVGNPSSYTMMSIAFAPANIAMVDTQLPDGALTQAYNATLHATGGTAAYTFSCSGLPPGITLTSTSLGTLGGTPSATGQFSSVSCSVTDGTVTSSPATFTINIGASLATPALSGTPVNSNVGSSWALTSVPRGAVILVKMSAFRSATSSYTAPTVGMSDSHSITFTRVIPYENARYAGLVTYVGVNCTAGNDTVTFNGADKGVGSPIVSSAEVWTGVQPVVDAGVGQALVWKDTSSHTNTTPGYTPPVSGGVLQAVTVTGFVSSGTLTLSLNSPFSSISTDSSGFGQLISGDLSVGTPSSVTASSTSTDSSGQSEGNSIQMFYLRPAIAGISTACGDVPPASSGFSHTDIL